MKPEDIPFNMKTFIGEDLRDNPEEPEEMRKGLDFLLKQMSQEKNDVERAQLMSLAGSFQRTLMDLEDAIQNHQKALKIFQEYDKEVQFLATSLRLAHAFHWKNNKKEADEIFVKLENYCGGHERHKNFCSFIYQHKGKFLFDQKQYDEAIEYFEKAQDIRKNLEDDLLLQSTKYAIKICAERSKE